MLKIFNDSLDKWNSIVSSFDYYDYYSLYEWGELRKKNNWQILRIINIKNNKITFACQIFYKKKFFINFFWIPGGPLGSYEEFSKRSIH